MLKLILDFVRYFLTSKNHLISTLYSKVFVVADYEFDIGFSEFRMADPIWWTWNFGNSTIFA